MKMNSTKFEQLQKLTKYFVRNSLPGKTKKDYFSNLNIRYLPDNRKFCETIKSYFSNKANSNKLLITERDKLVYNKNNGLPSIFINDFISTTSNLELKNPLT